MIQYNLDIFLKLSDIHVKIDFLVFTRSILQWNQSNYSTNNNNEYKNNDNFSLFCLLFIPDYKFAMATCHPKTSMLFNCVLHNIIFIIMYHPLTLMATYCLLHGPPKPTGTQSTSMQWHVHNLHLNNVNCLYWHECLQIKTMNELTLCSQWEQQTAHRYHRHHIYFFLSSLLQIHIILHPFQNIYCLYTFNTFRPFKFGWGSAAVCLQPVEIDYLWSIIGS